MPFQLKHEQNQNFPLEQIIGSAPHALQLTDTSKEEKRHHKKKRAQSGAQLLMGADIYKAKKA
jgi:hypothetical protein